MDPFNAYIGSFKRVVHLDPSIRCIQKWFRTLQKRQYLKHLADISRQIDHDRRQRHYSALCQFTRASKHHKLQLQNTFFSGWHLFAQRQHVVEIMQKRLTYSSARVALKAWRFLTADSYSGKRQAVWAEKRILRRRRRLLFVFWARWSNYEVSLRQGVLPKTYYKPCPTWNRYLSRIRADRILESMITSTLGVKLSCRVFFKGWLFVLRTEQRVFKMTLASNDYRRKSLLNGCFSKWHISFFYTLRFSCFVAPQVLGGWLYVSKRDKRLRERFPQGVALCNKMNMLFFFRVWLKFHCVKDQLALSSTLVLANNKKKTRRYSLFLACLLGLASPEVLLWKVLLVWKRFSIRRSLVCGLGYFYYVNLLKKYFKNWKIGGTVALDKSVFLVPMDLGRMLAIGCLNSSIFRSKKASYHVTAPLNSVDLFNFDPIKSFDSAPLHVQAFIGFKRRILEILLNLSGLGAVFGGGNPVKSTVAVDSTVDFFSLLIQSVVLTHQSISRSRQLVASSSSQPPFKQRVFQSNLVARSVIKSSKSGIDAYIAGLSDPIKSYLIETIDRINKDDQRLPLLLKSADFQVEQQARYLNQINQSFRLPRSDGEYNGLFSNKLLSSLGYWKGSRPKSSDLQRLSSMARMYEEEDSEVSSFKLTSEVDDFSADSWILSELRALYPNEELTDKELVVRHPQAYSTLKSLFEAAPLGSVNVVPTPNTRKIAKLVKVGGKLNMKELYKRKTEKENIISSFLKDHHQSRGKQADCGEESNDTIMDRRDQERLQSNVNNQSNDDESPSFTSFNPIDSDDSDTLAPHYKQPLLKKSVSLKQLYSTKSQKDEDPSAKSEKKKKSLSPESFGSFLTPIQPLNNQFLDKDEVGDFVGQGLETETESSDVDDTSGNVFMRKSEESDEVAGSEVGKPTSFQSNFPNDVSTDKRPKDLSHLVEGSLRHINNTVSMTNSRVYKSQKESGGHDRSRNRSTELIESELHEIESKPSPLDNQTVEIKPRKKVRFVDEVDEVTYTPQKKKKKKKSKAVQDRFVDETKINVKDNTKVKVGKNRVKEKLMESQDSLSVQGKYSSAQDDDLFVFNDENPNDVQSSLNQSNSSINYDSDDNSPIFDSEFDYSFSQSLSGTVTNSAPHSLQSKHSEGELQDTVFPTKERPNPNLNGSSGFSSEPVDSSQGGTKVAVLEDGKSDHNKPISSKRRPKVGQKDNERQPSSLRTVLQNRIKRGKSRVTETKNLAEDGKSPSVSSFVFGSQIPALPNQNLIDSHPNQEPTKDSPPITEPNNTPTMGESDSSSSSDNEISLVSSLKTAFDYGFEAESDVNLESDSKFEFRETKQKERQGTPISKPLSSLSLHTKPKSSEFSSRVQREKEFALKKARRDQRKVHLQSDFSTNQLISSTLPEIPFLNLKLTNPLSAASDFQFNQMNHYGFDGHDLSTILPLPSASSSSRSVEVTSRIAGPEVINIKDVKSNIPSDVIDILKERSSSVLLDTDEVLDFINSSSPQSSCSSPKSQPSMSIRALSSSMSVRSVSSPPRSRTAPHTSPVKDRGVRNMGEHEEKAPLRLVRSVSQPLFNVIREESVFGGVGSPNQFRLPSVKIEKRRSVPSQSNVQSNVQSNDGGESSTSNNFNTLKHQINSTKIKTTPPKPKSPPPLSSENEWSQKEPTSSLPQHCSDCQYKMFLKEKVTGKPLKSTREQSCSVKAQYKPPIIEKKEENQQDSLVDLSFSSFSLADYTPDRHPPPKRPTSTPRFGKSNKYIKDKRFYLPTRNQIEPRVTVSAPSDVLMVGKNSLR
ncbi:hypothetical protein P9112_002418 [Eukaryota sp. TZLM1-RC]